MSQIKICGLSREEDITYVNNAGADYAGFILHFPKSHRNVTLEKAAELRKLLAEEVKAVGVFVNQPLEKVVEAAELVELDVIQLHGQESEQYIFQLKEQTRKPVMKAFQIKTKEDVRKAEKCSAEYILLDSGQGTGKCFDWELLKDIKRPFFLAGGIDTENMEKAIEQLHPYAIDISSGVETERIKDQDKIRKAVKIAHKEEER